MKINKIGGYKMSRILQLKISLVGLKPMIWRRLLVEDSISFYKLHNIIQKAMGWENYHLFEFDQGSLSIGIPEGGDYSSEIKDSKKIKLSHVFTEEKQILNYIYDFGDSWKHKILVEKILVKDHLQKYPLCIDGNRSCPPEDCGGVWGYEEMLEIKSDKSHPEYEEKIVEWLGEDFDPEKFDIEEVNKLLKK
jgi:hypothetical protein